MTIDTSKLVDLAPLKEGIGAVFTEIQSQTQAFGENLNMHISGARAALAPDKAGDNSGLAGHASDGVISASVGGDTQSGGAGFEPLVGPDSTETEGAETPQGDGGEDPNVQKQKSAADQIKGIWSGLEQFKDGLNAKRLKGEEDTLASTLGAIVANTKAAKKISKAFGIGEIIVKTAMGVQNALATGVFPLNLKNAAVIAAKGATNLATVKGQFHEGIQSVPSTGTYLLERGERVLDSRLNADLKGFLKGMQSLDRPAGPQINLTVNGNPDSGTLTQMEDRLAEVMRNVYAERGMDSPF